MINPLASHQVYWEGASDDEALSDFWPYEGESRGDVPGVASFYLNVKAQPSFHALSTTVGEM